MCTSSSLWRPSSDGVAKVAPLAFLPLCSLFSYHELQQWNAARSSMWKQRSENSSKDPESRHQGEEHLSESGGSDENKSTDTTSNGMKKTLKRGLHVVDFGRSPRRGNGDHPKWDRTAHNFLSSPLFCSIRPAILTSSRPQVFVSIVDVKSFFESVNPIPFRKSY